MGLKEYVENKKMQKDAPKYSCGKIYMLYDSNGIIAPFVFNNEYKKIKDLASERIVELRGLGADYVKVALQEMYGIEDFSGYHYDNLKYMVYKNTRGCNIPGKVFRDVRWYLFVYDNMMRSDALDRSPLCDTAASYYDLQPLISKMSYEIKKAYNKTIKENKTHNEIDKNFEF